MAPEAAAAAAATAAAVIEYTEALVVLCLGFLFLVWIPSFFMAMGRGTWTNKLAFGRAG